MIESIQGQRIIQQNNTYPTFEKKHSVKFNELLQLQLEHANVATNDLTFSKHALYRAEERGIEINQALIDQLKSGMIKAQEKGAKNILALDAEKAFIINVPNAKVITAITQDEMQKNVFTNIDGAVFL